MRRLNLFGSLPGAISEGTRPWDWLGQLFLDVDPGLIRFVDIDGAAGSFLDASINRQLGSVVIRPLALVDHEAFTRAGHAPELSFTLRFTLADGTVAQSAQAYRVAVLDLDDAPPESLSFLSGGSVAVRAAGAVVGRLGATDPDTATGLTFRVAEEDSWLFEVAGDVLRLRPGMALDVIDGPVRPVTVEVSDGRQSSAFTLSVEVLNPAVPGSPRANVLTRGESRDGFFWLGDMLVGQWSANDLLRVREAPGLIGLTLDDRRDVWAERPRILELIDARVTFDPKAPEARVWHIHDTLMGTDPSPFALSFMGDAFRFNWYGEAAWARDLMNTPEYRAKWGGLSNYEFARSLYRNSVDWVGDEAFRWHAGRLDAGLPREQLVMDIVAWRDAIGLAHGRAEAGFLVERPQARAADVLLRLGADLPPGQLYRDWHGRLHFGQSDLKGLAEWVTQQPGFWSKWGGHHPWAFVEGFFAAAGSPIQPHQISWYAWEIAWGRMSRAEFMADAIGWINNPASGSYVHEQPEGARWLLG